MRQLPQKTTLWMAAVTRHYPHLRLLQAKMQMLVPGRQSSAL